MIFKLKGYALFRIAFSFIRYNYRCTRRNKHRKNEYRAIAEKFLRHEGDYRILRRVEDPVILAGEEQRVEHREGAVEVRRSRSADYEQHRADPGCKCRHLSFSERRELEAAGRKAAWKIKVPDKAISFCDGHYGKFSENLADGGDFIIKRSDGVYAYQLAVSFDDMDMGITRVVRGRDLLSSTARQIWLISELGGDAPKYYHAPLIVGADGRKLSKRYGELGAEALLKTHASDEIIGYIAGLLGISDGSPHSAAELVSEFDWGNVSKADILI